MCVRSTYTLVYLSMQLERQTSWPLTPGKAECVVLSVTQHLINTEGARQFAFEHFATYQESCDRFCDCCARARQIRYSFRYLHPTNKSILSYSDTQCTFSNLLISISQFKWRKECLCSAYTFHYCLLPDGSWGRQEAISTANHLCLDAEALIDCLACSAAGERNWSPHRKHPREQTHRSTLHVIRTWRQWLCCTETGADRCTH